MKLDKLIYESEIEIPKKYAGREVSYITTDPKSSTKEALLFVLTGRDIDVLDNNKSNFLVAVFDKNVSIPKKLSGRDNVFKYESARSLLAYACFRESEINLSRTKFIGITGTNGKSSTATLIKEILSYSGIRVGFIGTGRIECNGTVISDSNYSMTTPDPWILYPAIRKMQDAECGVIVMEVSSHSLALDKLAPISFEYGIFTNLSSEHIDFHKSINEYFEAKLKLFKKCNNAFFNLDDYYGRVAYKDFKKRKVGVGILWQGDVWATGIQNHGFDGTEYMYRERTFLFKMRLSLAGIHNIYNSLFAAAVCIDMGIKPCDVKQALSAVALLPGRFEIIRNNVTVIIDYAHTPAAFEALLKEIRRAKLPSERLWTVFGCGGERDREKRPRFANVAEALADEIIITEDNTRSEPAEQIISDITRGFKTARYEVIRNRTEAIKRAIINADDGDIIAIVGKGSEKYNIDSEGYHAFDERALIDEALLCRSVESYENKA